MTHRLIFAALLALTLVAGVARAAAPTPPITDPKAFVTSVYHRLETQKDYATPDDIYTPRLSALWALESKDAGGEVGRMDFDFWTNAQDWELKEVKVTDGPVEGGPDRRIVVATFKNDDRAEEIHFYFQKLAGHWRLDDARSAGKDGWTLSLILKYGFEGDGGS